MDKKIYSLDNRLMMCASLVPNGARLADIGTDHAYLPVWLIKNNIISYAIASDINKGPLESGRATAEKYHCSNIDFRLGSGLQTLTKDDNIDAVVIAGMGGELIADLLDASDLVQNKNLSLILQPMTKSEVLIKYLYNNGFEILLQDCTVSSNKCYTVMLARYTGVKENVSDYNCYTGKLDLANQYCKRFVKQHIANLENKAKGDHTLLPLLQQLKESI